MRYWLFRVKITGESMWPVLVPGRSYWATSLLAPKVGRLAVFRMPHSSQFAVKRIVELKNGRLELAGTVSWSSSFEIDADQFVGILLGHFTKTRD